MTDYECVGGPLDGQRISLAEGTEDHLIEMNGWAYVVEGSTLAWRRLTA